MSVSGRGVFLGKELLQIPNRTSDLVRPGFGTMKNARFRQSDVGDCFQLEGVINGQGTVQREVFDQKADDAAINVVLHGFIEEGRDTHDERLWGRRGLLGFGAIRGEEAEREQEQQACFHENLQWPFWLVMETL